ncbi:hypothetical protein KR054_011586 [Drosophila jambulina]|nr:hypothetical protein KR054_011586 [Drosophila jambulina]
MPRSFSSFLSNRYNYERQNLNERYEAILPGLSNVSRSRKSRTGFNQRMKALTKSEININKRFLFYYGETHAIGDWRQGDDLPISIRRKMEERLNEQLMAIQPISVSNVFSHTIWTVQMPEESPVKPKIFKEGSYPEEGIITAVAKPKKRCGRKPKKKITDQLTVVPQTIKPPKVEEVHPPTPFKKPTERRHIKQKGEQFTCSNCSRTFNHSWLLVAHMRVHTGERPFVCPEQGCQKSFSDRSNLRTHQRSMRHHNWEHQCGQCGKFFNQVFYLNRHTLQSCRKYLMTAMHRRS